jgi:Lrp/AsnC family leucine-responsive transcriptional regulator
LLTTVTRYSRNARGVVASVSERVKKLEDLRVICGYSAKIHLRVIGFGLQAIVRVRTTHQHIQWYVSLFESIPEVLDVVRATGDDCFVVRWEFSEPEDLERAVDALAAHGSVTTAPGPSHPVSKIIALG